MQAHAAGLCAAAGNDCVLVTAGLDGTILAWSESELRSTQSMDPAVPDVDMSGLPLNLSKEVQMHSVHSVPIACFPLRLPQQTCTSQTCWTCLILVEQACDAAARML